MSSLWVSFGELVAQGKDNLTFIGVSAAIIAILFAVAILVEKVILKQPAKSIKNARYMAICGLMSALSAILMMFEIPLFFAPSFYEIDFGEVPALIGAFSLGPVAGVTIELCKILLKLLIKGTTTAFVGDLSNFMLGCMLVVPASVIYHLHKSKKSALAGLAVGTVVMTIVGSVFNAVYLLPKFSQLYGIPLDGLVAMGNEVNSSINSVTTMVLFAVVPFNLLKGALVTLITMVLYKRISPLLKTAGIHKRVGCNAK